jgi:hypothetical protein
VGGKSPGDGEQTAVAVQPQVDRVEWLRERPAFSGNTELIPQSK